MRQTNNFKLFLLLGVLTLALLERTGSEWVMREVDAVRNSKRNWVEPSWVWHPLKRTDKRERDWIYPTHIPQRKQHWRRTFSVFHCFKDSTDEAKGKRSFWKSYIYCQISFCRLSRNFTKSTVFITKSNKQ